MNAIVKYVDDIVKEFTPTNGFKQSAKRQLKDKPEAIWDKRENEPTYAKLANKDTNPVNVYDQPIDLIQLVQLEGEQADTEQSLYINGNPAVGNNPNRNKQHGFYFNADNCIGCHACESACAEKNETPSHLAFRSVGYVEGGSYPDFQRLNISMACNHCDDPVCLKGCPTGAYIKHTEYGAVLQDPDTCFGCGYCTWVCPYNAPQLDPLEGQVSKCNMCVDRLEVGLKPACVSACVGNALDFGVIEEVPDNREQAKTSIPGFPNPDISRPNIRFEQKRKLPEEMVRTDSAPIKYHLDRKTGTYKPGVDPKHGSAQQWNIDKLNSRENPLVIFTLATQAGIGAFILGFLSQLFAVDILHDFTTSNSYAWLPFVSVVLVGIGLFMSSTHLGKPTRFYRGFNNLRYSPVSREALGVALFFGLASIHWILNLPLFGFIFDNVFFKGISMLTAALAVISGTVGLFYMIKCYRIPARPFWNHWQTATAFVSSSVTLGGFILGTLAMLNTDTSDAMIGITHIVGTLIALGVGAELLGLYFHAKRNKTAEDEGAASHYVLTTTYGKTYQLRNALLAVTAVLALALAILPLGIVTAVVIWCALFSTALASQLIGRALFYVLVIPTTMPGAFFWRNKGFEEHAKETGLVDVVDAGIVRAEH